MPYLRVGFLSFKINRITRNLYMDINNTRKLYNPKSTTPAVYIPCWLIQVSSNELSHGAKILYGRLAQWSNSTGIVYRSCPQLAKELGMGISSIERRLKELKDVNLIGTYHPQAGGLNHYEFYDHPWMHAPLVDELTFRSTPPSELTVPPVRIDGTPPSKVTDINIKEIKETINPLCASSAKSTIETFESFWNLYPTKKAKKKCLEIWKRRKLDSLATEILKNLSNQIENDEQWKRGYIPNPSTYLNQDRWTDELTISKQTFEMKERIIKAEQNQQRLEEQEKLSLRNHQYEQEKFKQYKENAASYRNIKKIIPKIDTPSIPQGFKDLKTLVGLK
jgi:hypothetical protein